jgi:dCMP deaminase
MHFSGIGYNGFPTGCSDDALPWCKDKPDRSQTKYMYVCHAEMNAILNKNSSTVENCRIYVALFPCNECAKMIIQSGIVEVIYFSDKHAEKPETIASKKLFDMAGVAYRQFIPANKKIVIDFDVINA